MKTRIISAAVAIVIALAVLALHKTIVLEIAVALLICGMLYEIFKAAGCEKYYPAEILCLAYGVVSPFSQYIWKAFPAVQMIFVMLVFACFLWQYKTVKFEKLAIMLVTTLLVTTSMCSLLTIHKMFGEHGLFVLILTLCGAWLADSGAYFAGTFFGKHKLCPNISPKKTVEGFIGGTLTNGLIFVIMGAVYGKLIADVSPDFFLLFVLGMACSAVGLLGDLSASLVKRQYSIKDYGNIMPGHGGVMDRFDSVLFVAPFMAVMLSTFELFA